MDTSHLWASGFDMRDPALVKEYMEAIRNYNPIIHFNDNIHPLGSLKDEHDSLGAGQIWKDGVATTYREVFEAGYPIIFERSKTDYNVDYAIARKYYV